MSVSLKKRREERERVGDADVLDNLRKCQNDIILLRRKYDREAEELEKRYARSVKPYLEKRNDLIQSIPRLWSKSILNHPLLSTVFEPGESDVMNYLSKLRVEECEHPEYFKIHFSFRKNPYFDNRTLTKEFAGNGSTNSAVRWKPGHKFPKAAEHELWEHDDLRLEYKGFFRWFFDPEEHYCDPIADIIRTCIWHNPLEFYDSETAVGDADREEAAEAAAEGPVAQKEESASGPERVVRGKEKPGRKVKKGSPRSAN